MPRAFPSPSEYLSRDDLLLRHAENKRVLHLGCVGETDNSTQQRAGAYRSTLHSRLTEHAESVVGVDMSEGVVNEWRRRYDVSNVLVGDVEKLELLELASDFDLIVAGDIIEHLSSPGLMLDGIHRICDTDTTVIITTPNAFGLPNYLRFLRGTFRDGDEHVLTFNSVNLVQLLERHHFKVIDLMSCWQPHSAEVGGVAFTLGKRVFREFPKLGGTLLAVAVTA